MTQGAFISQVATDAQEKKGGLDQTTRILRGNPIEVDHFSVG